MRVLENGANPHGYAEPSTARTANSPRRPSRRRPAALWRAPPAPYRPPSSNGRMLRAETGAGQPRQLCGCAGEQRSFLANCGDSLTECLDDDVGVLVWDVVAGVVYADEHRITREVSYPSLVLKPDALHVRREFRSAASEDHEGS